MLNSLSFSVTSPPCCFPSTLAICGNLPSLGSWDPSLALPLLPSTPTLFTTASPLLLPTDTRFEFKLILLHPTSPTIWQTLPNDLNRKFKISHDVILEITWGEGTGKKRYSGVETGSKPPGETRERDRSLSLEKLLRYKPQKMARSKKEENFSPFQEAYNSEEVVGEYQSENERGRGRVAGKGKHVVRRFTRMEYEYLLMNESKTGQRRKEAEAGKDDDAAIEHVEELVIVSSRALTEDTQYLEIANNASRPPSLKIKWVASNQVSADGHKAIAKYQHLQFIFLNQTKVEEQHRIQEIGNRINEVATESSVKILLMNQELQDIAVDKQSTKIQFNNCASHHPLQDVTNLSFSESQSGCLKDQPKTRFRTLLSELTRSPLAPPTFDIPRYSECSRASFRKLYVFDLEILLNKDTKEITVNTQNLNKVESLTKEQPDSCIILYTSRSSLVVQQLLSSELNSNLPVIIIASSGAEVYFNRQWLNLPSFFLGTLSSLRRILFKHHLLSPGSTITEHNTPTSFSLTYSLPHLSPKIPQHQLISELKSFLSDKTLVKLTISPSAITITIPFSQEMAMVKVVQLGYLHQGAFDFVASFEKGKGEVERKVREMVGLYPMFFKRDVEQFHVKVGGGRERQNRIDEREWKEMEL